MISEIGHMFLILAFSLSCLQFITSVKVSISSSQHLFSYLSRQIMMIISILLILSFITLISAYALSDFSILNVFNNSHTNKPLIYKISGTRGNHEGSLMMWLAILGIYGGCHIVISKKLPDNFANYVTLSLSIIYVGFIGFTLFTSNPFMRAFPIPEELSLIHI